MMFTRCDAPHARALILLTIRCVQRYINPNATEEQISKVSHWMVAFYALVIGLAGLIFFYIGVSMGWLYVSLLKRRFSAHIDDNHITDFHGRHTWISRRADCSMYYLEQGQQMGMYLWGHIWLLGWHHRVARYH